MNKIAILQSNYLPWKGVFDMIYRVDTFVFLEDVQYTEHDWRNRNKISTKEGVKWITVPINHSNRMGQKIYEAEINSKINWQRKHYNSFQLNYAKSPYFKQYEWILHELYKNNKWSKISDFNIYAIKLIAKELGINTQFVNSLDLKVKGIKDERIIEICKKLKATHYLSGPAAKNYIVPQRFKDADIELDYIKYEYPKYKQLYEPFNHYVTILDLLFNCGSDASYYIWGWKEAKNKGVIAYDTL